MSVDWWPLQTTVCDLSILFRVTLPVMAGTYTVQLAWAQRGPRARRKGAGERAEQGIAVPPGVATDRLGTSGQIWESNINREKGECPAAREQPSSRAASQNALLTANLQTRGILAAGQAPASALLLWPYTLYMTSLSSFSLASSG